MKRKVSKSRRRSVNKNINISSSYKSQPCSRGRLFIFRKWAVLGLLGLFLGGIVFTTISWGKERYEKYVEVYNNFTPSLAPGDVTSKKPDFQYQRLSLEKSFNVVFVGLDRKDSGHIKADSVMIIHYNPQELSFTVVGLPVKSNYYYQKKGQYVTLQNIYALGQIQTPESGMTDLISTLESSLAVKIHGYVATDFEGVTSISEEIGKLRIENETRFSDADLPEGKQEFDEGNLELEGSELLSFVRSDEGGDYELLSRRYGVLSSLLASLTKNDLYAIAGDVNDIGDHVFSNVSPDSLREIADLLLERGSGALRVSYPGQLVSEVEIDDEVLSIFDKSLSDEYFSSIFEAPDIIREQARISVYNGTAYSGLAGRFSRWIGNSGGDVIRISSQNGSYPQTVIFCEDTELYPNTISRIREILPMSVVINAPSDFTTTGDIVLVLGQDASEL